jgi:phosphoribosyl-AMP cyclohydrolase
MLAHMNQAAWEQTVATGQAVYYSRSRGRLWKKGEQSGHVQQVREIYVDCDGDAVLLRVEQTGAACHEGYESCFFRRHDNGGWQVVGDRIVDPDAVYKKT